MSIHPTKCITQIIMKQSSDIPWIVSDFFSGIKAKFCSSLYCCPLQPTSSVSHDVIFERHKVKPCHCQCRSNRCELSNSCPQSFYTRAQTILSIGKTAIKLLLMALYLGLQRNLVLSQHAKAYFLASLPPVQSKLSQALPLWFVAVQWTPVACKIQIVLDKLTFYKRAKVTSMLDFELSLSSLGWCILVVYRLLR